MQQKQCALCSVPLTNENKTAEHIIPNAIGGRKKVRWFICRDCNSKKGNSWDAALAAELNPLCLILGIARQKGAVPSRSFETIGGQGITLNANGQMTFNNPRAQIKEKDGELYIDVKARTPLEAKKLLSGFKRDYPDLNVDAIISKMDNQPTYLDDPVKMSFQFDGPLIGRSVVKSALAFAFCEGIKPSLCKEALAYLKDKDASPCFGFYYQSDPILNRPNEGIFHCVGITGSSEQGTLLAYVEFFGAQRNVVCLAKNYIGPNIHSIYAIDPTNGEQLDLSFEIPVAQKDIEALYQHKMVPTGAMESAFKSPLRYAQRLDHERSTNQSIGDAVDYAFKKCGAVDGEEMTREQVKDLANLMTKRISPFIKRRIRRN